MPVENIRRLNNEYFNNNTKKDIIYNETKYKKAPGSDGSETEIIKSVWKANRRLEDGDSTRGEQCLARSETDQGDRVSGGTPCNRGAGNTLTSEESPFPLIWVGEANVEVKFQKKYLGLVLDNH